MLILNLHAVPALLAVFIAAGVLGATIGSESEWFTFLLFGAVPFVAGRISARLGLQDRFFFMPSWWIGMLGMSSFGLIPLGVPSFLAWVPGAIGIGLLRSFYKTKLEERLWKKARAKSHELSDRDPQKEFWKLAKKAVFFPEKLPVEEAMIAHNQAILQRFRQRIAGSTEMQALAHETIDNLEQLLVMQRDVMNVDAESLSEEDSERVSKLNRATVNQFKQLQEIAALQVKA